VVTVTTTFKSGGDTIVTYKVARMPSTARFRRAFSLATADTYPVTVDRGRTDTHTHRDETESPTHASRRLPANLNLKL